MKRWSILLVVVIGFGIFSGLVSAQEETFNWEPYNFTITLPDTWTALEDGDRLLLGEPEHVNQLFIGETPSGLTLTVHIVPSPIAPDFPADFEFSQFVDSDWITSTGEGDGLTMRVAEIPPSANGLVGRLVFIEPNYMIAAVAPEQLWTEATQTLLDNLFANIWVSPDPLPRDRTLTQRFTWRDLSFSTPRDWFLSSAGNQFQMIARTYANHLYSSRSFIYAELTVAVRDLSYLRPLLTAESVLDFGAFGYRPERNPMSETATFEMNGMDVTSVDMLDDDGVTERGKAALLLTPQHAYLFIGFADPEPWAESEGDLFEAILKTVVIE